MNLGVVESVADQGQRIEVRCCCDPGKLLGSIPASPQFTDLGKFMVPGIKGPVEVELAWLGPWWSGRAAIKSNDLPIEYYEQIRGWLPAEGVSKVNLQPE
jgi:hypothetical protein